MKNISEMFGSIGLVCTVGNEVSRANNDDREKWRAAKVIGLHHPLISRVETSRLPSLFLAPPPSFPVLLSLLCLHLRIQMQTGEFTRELRSPHDDLSNEGKLAPPLKFTINTRPTV